MTFPAILDASRNASPFLYGPEGQAVLRALHSGQYGHTEITEQFERDIAQFLGVPDAVAVASGTAALHIALLAAGIGPGDEVIVPSMTFCATIQAITACGATPRFIEVDPGTLCVTGHDVLEAVTPATRAVLPVLYGGRAVDLSGIHDALAERGILVIEDAAHAFGSFNGTTRVGASGHATTCFSFGPIKNLTCGQGGLIIPRGVEAAKTARSLRLLGVIESAAERSAATSYTVAGFGLRYQMSSINAAIGSVQLANFTTAESARKKLWRAYKAALAPLDGVTLVDVDVEHSVPSLCVVRVPWRDRVFDFLREHGVGVGVHYPPNHLQPAFARWHRPLPATEAIGQQILTLPFHQHLTEEHVQHVASLLEKALTVAEASR
ncbi:MAG: DegT/DnrJ/EryC1/StrS family aminotransferase [Streptomycetaceae bacterium]|nr:DegT/DnrJ/EryC1/StrS family aminotransferase [Streptomycetaceae bacterium]